MFEIEMSGRGAISLTSGGIWTRAVVGSSINH
jgi:hypothetical protein